MKPGEPSTNVIGVDERTRLLETTINEHRDALHTLSIYLSDNPELAFKEFLAHDAAARFLEDQGFEVQREHSLETSFQARFTYGQGGRTWGLQSEYDALPDIGHACG